MKSRKTSQNCKKKGLFEMTKKELKKNGKYWCWWLHRSLYYTGKVIKGKYIFIDICDAQFRLSEDDLEKLTVR